MILLLLFVCSVCCEEIRPFKLNIDEEILVDLKVRLELARIAPALPIYNNDTWGRGTNVHYLKELIEYWKTTYNWRAQEKILNEKLPQFSTLVDDIDLHFVHIQSSHPDAEPFLFVHGWPGSFYECIKIAELLVNPPADQPAFHLVCPSIPGYGYSKVPPNRAMPDHLVTAQLLHKLMLKLGYEKYWLQGGDWGSLITKLQAWKYPESIIGYHTNMPSGNTKGIIPMLKTLLINIWPSMFLSEEDYKVYQIVPPLTSTLREMGYFVLQSTKPQTIGVALDDSPVALATYIIEKFYTWSDCNGNIESRFTKDDLLNNIMIYWTSRSATTSVNYYFEYWHSDNDVANILGDIYLDVPTAAMVFPKEIRPALRVSCEGYYNIKRWTVASAGGHFAALEEPDVLISDIRQFRLQLQSSANPKKQDL